MSENQQQVRYLLDIVEDLRKKVDDLEFTIEQKPNIAFGSGAPSLTPTQPGDFYYDTTNDVAYKAMGTTSSDWETIEVAALPDQAGNSGKYLTTDGTDASWGTVSTGGGGGDLTTSLAIVAEARKRGSNIPLPVPNTMVEANEAGRVKIDLHTSYSSGTTTLKLKEKIFIETDNPVPIYITDDTTGNYDLIWIDELTAESSGEYTYSLSASVATGYTTGNDAYVTNSVADISGNQAQPNSDSTGDAAKSLESLLVQYVQNGTLSAASIQAYHRFYSQKFPADLSSYSSDDEISFDDDSEDYHDWFKDNDLIVLAKILYEDEDELVYLHKDLRQYRGSDDTSWYIFQMDGDSTYSDPDITVTVDGVVSKEDGSIDSTLPTISDTDNWFVFRLGGLLQYLAGAKTATTLDSLTPTELIVNGGNQIIFEDDFGYANDMNSNGDFSLAGDWESTINSSNLSGGFTDGAVKFEDTGATNSLSDAFLYRTRESIGLTKIKNGLRIKVKVTINTNSGAGDGVAQGIIIGSNATDVSGMATENNNIEDCNGLVVSLHTDPNGGSGDRIEVGDNDGLLTNVAYSLTDGDEMWLLVETRDKNIKVKTWVDGNSEPTTWNINYTKGSDFNISGLRFILGMACDTASCAGYTLFDNLEITDLNLGYTLKYEGEGTDVDKWVLQDPSTVQDTDDPFITYDYGGALTES